MSRESHRELRRSLALGCRILAHDGLSAGAYGHISARVPGGANFFIKSRGPQEEGMEFARPRDIVLMDNVGSAIKPPRGLDAPREKYIHLGIYEQRPEVRCVIHAHPPAIVALTAAGVRLEPIVGAYDPAALDTVLRGISYYERSILIETMELGRAVAESMGQHNICLLKGHGVAITGHDVQDAVLRAVALNELARITLLARSISSDRDLELLDEQDLRFWSDRKSDPRRRLRADGQRPEWWYLRRQLKPRR